jgi:ABC-type amino acid transport substrate-binding protein
MKKTLFKLLGALALVHGTLQGTVQAKEIEVFWTDNPPLICQKNGELDCMAGILLKNAAKAGGFTLKTSEVPWARAVDALEKSPNAIFAANGRNEFSEKSAAWFFQVYSDNVNLFTLDAKKIGADADIAKLSKIIVRRGSPFSAYLKKKGAEDKIIETSDWKQGVSMVESGRADGMCLSNLIGTTNFITLGKLPESRLNRYQVGTISWWLITAANKPLSPELSQFKALLEAEKNKPAFQEIIKSYKVQN